MEDESMYVPAVVPIENERQIMVPVEGGGLSAHADLMVLTAGEGAIAAGASEVARVRLGGSRAVRMLAQSLLDAAEELDRRR